jgi:hypothetical protein
MTIFFTVGYSAQKPIQASFTIEHPNELKVLVWRFQMMAVRMRIKKIKKLNFDQCFDSGGISVHNEF